MQKSLLQFIAGGDNGHLVVNFLFEKQIHR